MVAPIYPMASCIPNVTYYKLTSNMNPPFNAEPNGKFYREYPLNFPEGTRELVTGPEFHPVWCETLHSRVTTPSQASLQWW